MTLEEILEFERAAPTGRRAREGAIRARFGISSVRYHAALVEALDDPRAPVHDGPLVGRLLRLRDARRRLRTAQQIGLAAPRAQQDARQARMGEP